MVRRKTWILLFLTVLQAVLFVTRASAELPAPRVHWRLAGDASVVPKLALPAVNQGVEFSATGPRGKPSSAAKFAGRGQHLRFPAAPQWAFGQEDFTVSLWLHTESTLDDDLGDIISQYDSRRRKGWQLSLRNHAGVTNSQANFRQLQFGIDDGSKPQFRDEGRPGNSLYGMSLVAHDGALYVGTCEPELNQAGHVYRYSGTGKWDDLGSPDQSNSVAAMAAYEGSLFVGTAKYRLAGSVLPESKNLNLGGKIFRYDGKQGWVSCGQLPETESVGGLVVYRGKLYAGSMYRPAGFFRYEGGTTWTRLPTFEGKRVESLGVYNGSLWATTYDGGFVYRYNGDSWRNMGRLGDNSQTYSFAVHRGSLYVGTWKSGRVFRFAEKSGEWTDAGRLGEELEVMGMLDYNGQLYAGSLPLAEVYRQDGNTSWTKLAVIDPTPGVKYRRAWTTAAYQGRLFWTTLPSGHIHSMTAGACVTHDRELPAGWHHIAAVKEKGRLKLHVDGREVAVSEEFDAARYNLTNDAPLLIGSGSGDSFNGLMSDLKLFATALSAEQIGELSREQHQTHKSK